jgi:hypothetical protein
MAVERGDRQLLNLLERSIYELGPRQLGFAVKIQAIRHGEQSTPWVGKKHNAADPPFGEPALAV